MSKRDLDREIRKIVANNKGISLISLIEQLQKSANAEGSSISGQTIRTHVLRLCARRHLRLRHESVLYILKAGRDALTKGEA